MGSAFWHKASYTLENRLKEMKTTLCFTLLLLGLSCQVKGKKSSGGWKIDKIHQNVKDIKKSVKQENALSFNIVAADVQISECSFTVNLVQATCGNFQTFGGTVSGGTQFTVPLPPAELRTCQIQDISSSCTTLQGGLQACDEFTNAVIPPQGNYVYEFKLKVGSIGCVIEEIIN